MKCKYLSTVLAAVLAAVPFVADAANAWMQSARTSPEWFTRGVMYQIQPRAFTPEGTLKAAEKKLAYLKDLGVTIAYLVPVMKMDADGDKSFWSPRQIRSGFDNPKNQYRIADYFHVDEEYGTDQDLKDFCAAAHRLGMKVVFDLVYLHCGPTAPFLREHPEFTWWNPDGTVKKGPWRFPKLNFAEPKLREYLIGNIRHLIKEFGADGFRCDVGDGIPLDFWCDAHDMMDGLTGGNAVLLCEGFTVCDQYKGFDADYGWFPGLSAASVRGRWTGRAAQCPVGSKFVNHYENHDIATDARPRREEAWGHAAVDQVLVWMFTLDGVPMLFTGNEMADADERHSMFGKTPMDWSQLDREPGKSRHALVKRLAALRREHPAFTDVNGTDGLTWLDTTAKDAVTAFVRRNGRETVLVVQNWTKKPVKCGVSFTVPKHATASYLAPDETDRDVKGTIAAEPLFARDAAYSPEEGFTVGPFGWWISKIETDRLSPACQRDGFTAYSMLTRDGRRMVSYVEGTNTVYELVPTNRLPADLPPVREWKLYGLKATHTDIGLHNSQYIQRHGTVKRIDQAARLVDADTRSDDDPAAYRYVMEGTWFWDNYHQDKGMDAAWRIVTNYMARGRMDVGVTCAGNHTHLFSKTEIDRSALTKKYLADTWGIGTRTFIMADNPGISCSVIAPYVRAGIKYGLFLPNQWNPIPSTIWKKNADIMAGTWNPDAMGGGARVEVSYDSPLPMVFRWKAPGGDESLLMWCSTQYGYGYSRLGLQPGNEHRSTIASVEARMPSFLQILERKYPYDVWFASTYCDDETPNTKFADLAAAWNEKWAWPQFRTVGRLDEPFEYLEKHFGDKIPTLTGEMTSGWLQHAASTPELLADKLNADRMLETAERLGTFAGTIDRATVDRAWWYLILNDEHSYGTSGYKGRRVFETWMQHRDWVERAASTASNELAKAVAKLGLSTGTTGVPPVANGLTENRWYRVVVTNGVIYSIYDKELRRELLDAPANRFLYTRDNHKTWEASPEAALGAQVTRRVYLPPDAKRIDVEDRFEHARDLFNSRRYYRYGYLAFPFAVPDGAFTAHLNGTVIRPYEDCHPMSSDAYCAVRDWCAVENDAFGVALMMRDSTLTEFGEIHPDKTCYTGRPPRGKTTIYPYLFTDWLQMHQPDGDSMNFTFRFSITSYAGGWKAADVPRVCAAWLNPYAEWMRAHNVPCVTRDAVAEPPPGWTGLIEKPRAGHGEKDGQMYVLWGAEMSPDFSHYELWRDGAFLANVTNEVPDGIPYRVARYEDLGLPTHSRHEYRIRKVWKDGRKDALGAPFFGLTRSVSAEACHPGGGRLPRIR